MINHILKNNNTMLVELFKKLEELKQLNELLAKLIDPELANHCQVVKFEKNCLFVLTENGSWATQLRFQIPYLMIQLREHILLENLSGIICKIRPSIQHKKNPKPIRTVSPLSPEIATEILETAKTITDEKIRRIFEKIATRKLTSQMPK